MIFLHSDVFLLLANKYILIATALLMYRPCTWKGNPTRNKYNLEWCHCYYIMIIPLQRRLLLNHTSTLHTIISFTWVHQILACQHKRDSDHSLLPLNTLYLDLFCLLRVTTVPSEFMCSLVPRLLPCRKAGSSLGTRLCMCLSY